MTDIYCGSKKDVPKNKKRGSMKQCAELGEIRYYGIKKIDQKLVDAMEESKKQNSSMKSKLESKKRKLEGAYVGIVGKMTKLKSKIDAEKDKREKVLLQKEFDALGIKKAEIKMELALLPKQQSALNKKSKSSRMSRPVKAIKKKTKTQSKTKSKAKSKSKSKSKSKKARNVKRIR